MLTQEVKKRTFNSLWSIRTKILLMFSALLLGVVFIYLAVTEKIFREDKLLLIFNTNKSNIERLTDELDNHLRRIVDKVSLLASLSAQFSQQQKSTKISSLINTYFENDVDILYLRVLQISPQSVRVIQEFSSQLRLEKLKLSLSEIKSTQVLPLPQFDDVKEILLENKSLNKSILFLLTVPLTTQKNYYIVVQTVIHGRQWTHQYVRTQPLTHSFVITKDGTTFLHPDTGFITTKKNLTDIPIVNTALTQDFVLQQNEFKYKGHDYLGIYNKTSLGNLNIISMSSKNSVLQSSRLHLEKSLILSLIILTTVFLLSIFFTNSLSVPIKRLVLAAGQIAQGKFDTKLEIRSHDEIGSLADAFTLMAKDLKASRQQLEEYNHDLEQKINQRTQELAERNLALRNQQEALLQTSRLAAIGEIAGHAAHEILNPLTVIISRLEKLSTRTQQLLAKGGGTITILDTITAAWHEKFFKEGKDAWLKDISQPSHSNPQEPLVAEDIQNLHMSTNQLLTYGRQLIQDLDQLNHESFRISRIVEGMRGLSRMQKVRSHVNLPHLIKECVQFHEDLLERYKIDVSIQTQKEALLVYVDSDEMRQVFYNLIKNAIESIEERQKTQNLPTIESPGRIEIHIEVKNNMVETIFQDNGLGIPKDEWEKIFEPNFTTKGEKGTGIGLTICRRLIRSMGGELTLVDSQVGHYTIFKITLPQSPQVTEVTRASS